MTTTNMYAEYAWDDPIYRILRKETASPRFKLFLLKQNSKDIILYQYTDMLALQPRSGDNLDALFREHRRFLVREGVQTDANERMIGEFESNDNPYSDLEQEPYENARIWCG